MKRIFLFAILAMIMIGPKQIMGQMAFNSSPVKNVSADEAQLILKNKDIVILDIRTPMEYNTSRIEGAINIDFYESSFINNLNNLDKNKRYFVYCRSGNRTGQSMRIFTSLGFKDIVHLQRGIVEWTANGYEMIK
jgi:rhodanese-related sulfurtransferase